MAYLVDANTIIYVVGSQYPELTQRILATPVGEIQLSTIVFAELAIGSANGLAPSVKVLDRLATQMPLVSFDEAAARAYATLPFKRAGFDRLLAAHALSINATVITRNVKDFADIPGLKVENWAKS